MSFYIIYPVSDNFNVSLELETFLTNLIMQKTKQDFHESETCDQNTSNLDQTIISCPSCCIAIAKGDGCNTVFCVCGKQFSWAAEKESLQRSASFLAMYPKDTSETSALVSIFTPNARSLIQAKCELYSAASSSFFHLT